MGSISSPAMPADDSLIDDIGRPIAKIGQGLVGNIVFG